MRAALLALALAASGCQALVAGAQGFGSHPLGPNPGGGTAPVSCVTRNGYTTCSDGSSCVARAGYTTCR